MLAYLVEKYRIEVKLVQSILVTSYNPNKAGNVSCVIEGVGKFTVVCPSAGVNLI